MARLVCHSWNNIALHDDRLVINLKSKSDIQLANLCRRLSPSLARNITLRNCRNELTCVKEGVNGQLNITDIKNLSCFITLFNQYVQKLDMTLNPTLFPALYKLFQTRENFINLKYLDVHICRGEKNSEIPNDEYLPLAPRKKLSTIKFRIDKNCDAYRELYQGLLNCAVNLLNLRLVGNWLPDQGTQLNLKSLEYVGLGKLDLAKLSNLVFQVAHSLQYLHLYSEVDTRKVDPQKFKLPATMPNLIKLSNIHPNIFPIQIQHVMSNRMKNLRTIQLKDLSGDLLLNVFCSGNISNAINPCVSTLSLNGIVLPEVLAKVRVPFPNLRNLELILMPRNAVSRVVQDNSFKMNKAELNAVMGAIGSLNLRRITIMLCYPLKCRGFFKTLSNNLGVFENGNFKLLSMK